MIEQRRVRFASIDGISRADLPIAAEIWLEDLSRQRWINPGIQKFATFLMRYMTDSFVKDVTFRLAERYTGLDRKGVLEVLKTMQVFGAAEAYTIDGDVIRVSLALSVLQRLRTLEVQSRFRELSAELGVHIATGNVTDAGKWTPPGITPDALEEIQEETEDEDDGEAAWATSPSVTPSA